MKIKILIISTLLAVALAIMSFTKFEGSRYYYAYNEKVFLTESSNKLIVKYNQNKHADKKQISLSSELASNRFKWLDDSTCIITLSDKEKDATVEKISKQPDVKICNSVYTIDSGLEMGITDEFIVKFKDNASKSDIEKLHKKFNSKVVKNTEFYQLLASPTGSIVLDVANAYQESGLTTFSHPNFLSEFQPQQYIPNDPFFSNQFSLHNTGQVFTDGHSGKVDADIDAPEAWAITKGSGSIVIAVIDDAVTADHPDLPNSRQVRLYGSNFSSSDPNPISPTGLYNHGNACAGIIAATQGNNEGISGIAPSCKIMPICVTGVYQVNKIADAINFAWQNGADILSLSRTYNHTNPNTYPVICEALINATTKGRNNLGCVVVNCAGNTANHIQNNNGAVFFPSNVNIAGVITVGASDRYDLQANYSPTGNPNSDENQIIDIVAPSHRAYSFQIPDETWECWTIDIPSNGGYNPITFNDGGTLPILWSRLPSSGINYLAYTGRFGGTSYSSPQVAGVAALVLSIVPTLTQMQVFDIITSTADKVGGYVYTNGRSNELGFGRLNAKRAVEKALSKTTSINGSSVVCSANAAFILQNFPPSYTVKWSASSNLLYVSGDGTPSYTVKALNTANGGTGWVMAKIFENGNSDTITLKKDFWVGVPSQPKTIIGFPYNGKHFGSNSYYDFFSNEGLNQGINSYEWVVGGGTIEEGQGTNQITVLTCNAGDMNKYFDVSIRLGNACGWSPWLWRTGYVDGGVGPAYVIYPNPISNVISISPVENRNTNTLNIQQPEPIKCIRIFDKMGLLVKLQNYSGNDCRVTLNVSSLPKGVYLLKINEKESHTIIKE